MLLAGTAEAQGWAGAFEAGAARAVAGDSIYRDVGSVQAIVLRRFGDRFGAGVFADFRPVLDSTPASSFWYADLGVRSEVAFRRRFFVTVSAAWALRHISLSEGISSNRSGIGGAAGIGAAIVTWPRGAAVYLLVLCHTTWAVKSEDIAVTDLGLAVGFRHDLDFGHSPPTVDERSAHHGR